MKPCLTGERLETARNLAQERFARHRDNPHRCYENTFSGHFAGVAGEMTAETWLASHGAKKLICNFYDVLKDSVGEPDIVMLVPFNSRIQIKTWTRSNWGWGGRVVSFKQYPRLLVTIDRIFWCILDEHGNGKAVVAPHKWSKLDDFRKARRVKTGPAQIDNLQLDEKDLRPLEEFFVEQEQVKLFET